MSNSSLKIGIDYRNGQYYTARVENEKGRPEVKALLRCDKDNIHKHPLLKSSEFIISVPDDKVIIKKIAFDSSDSDFDLKVKFELAQRIGEDEKNFYSYTIPTGIENNFLGIIIRKNYFDKLSADISNSSENLSVNGEMRSSAMAKGYLNFCQLVEGDLVCLADFCESQVSIAFIYKNQILDLTYLSLNNLNINSDFEKAAIELKTLIDFKLAAFFNDGITVPLSSLLVIGDNLEDSQISILDRFFQSKVQKPQIHTGFFSNQSKLADIPLEKYLTALGLTIN